MRTRPSAALSPRGDASYVWYDFVGRQWRLFVNDERASDDYRAEAAFVRRTGFTMNSTTIGYEFQGENTWWVRARPFLVAQALRLPDGTLDESYAGPGVDVTFARLHRQRRTLFLKLSHNFRR